MTRRLSLHSLDQLIALAKRSGHRLARDVVDELARRGDEAVAAFERLLREPWPWEDDELDAWFLRLHAVMTMGLVASERAGAVLLAFLQRMGAERDDELLDWLSGFWPALLRNKPAQVESLWREWAMKRSGDVYARVDAVEVVLALAERDGPEPLETALDWAATLAADASEAPPIRALVASCLLDFPRERFRTLLQDVARQTAGEDIYDEEDVATAFAAGEDTPAWRDFSDPWIFYDPAEMDRREERWAAEAAEAEVEMPYVREAAKTGRNDPCPCGSGKKFKRCCGAAPT